MENKRNYFWMFGILGFVILGLVVYFCFFNKKSKIKNQKGLEYFNKMESDLVNNNVFGALRDISADMKTITLPNTRTRIILYDSNDKILKYYTATKDNDVYRIPNEDPEIKKYLVDVI